MARKCFKHLLFCVSLIGLMLACVGCAASGSSTGKSTALISAPVRFVTSDIDWEPYLNEVGMVSHPPLSEISGIERSQAYPDLWWVQNDSGDEPRIFGIDQSGKVIMPVWQGGKYFVDVSPADAQTSDNSGKDQAEPAKLPWFGVHILNAANQDWEDLTLDGDKLYIADTGNNGNAKRDLGIYIVNEPNPAEMDQGTRPITFLMIAYPDQHAFPPAPPDDWRFDCESVFISDGKLYFLTKYRADCRFDRITTGTSLYRLDTMQSDKVNTLTLVHRADDLPITPTSADVSPDGSRLAVLSHEGIWLFNKPENGDDWLSSQAIQIKLSQRIKQAEGVCWDDDETLRIVNEQRGVLTLDLSALNP